MDAKTRNWLMLWTLKGRPRQFSLEAFVSLPLEAVLATYADKDDAQLHFEALDARGYRYTLDWPRQKGGYLTVCWRLYAPVRWRSSLPPREYCSCCGSFNKVMAAIRRWSVNAPANNLT